MEKQYFDHEAWFDAEMLPKLKEISKACSERGIPHVFCLITRMEDKGDYYQTGGTVLVDSNKDRVPPYFHTAAALLSVDTGAREYLMEALALGKAMMSMAAAGDSSAQFN